MRGEELNNLNSRSADLQTRSESFNRTADNLKCLMCKQNAKTTLILITIILIITSLIILFLYAGYKILIV